MTTSPQWRVAALGALADEARDFASAYDMFARVAGAPDDFGRGDACAAALARLDDAREALKNRTARTRRRSRSRNESGTMP